MVLVVDGAVAARQALQATLSSESDMTVTVAPNGAVTAERLEWWRPDVILLDVDHLPLADVSLVLRSALAAHPQVPVVTCSANPTYTADLAFHMFELGVVAFVSRPAPGQKELRESDMSLAEMVREAASAASPSVLSESTRPAREPQPARSSPRPPGVVAIGASTGGTEAVEHVVQALPADGPALVVVIHMPPVFTAAFAQRLDKHYAISVKEAQAGDEVVEGRVLVAPGGRHLELREQGSRIVIQLSDGPLVSRHRPSVDVLFASTAEVMRDRALGVLMTGMGSDGALGLLLMRRAGAPTIAQDEASCVVFGMPKEAIRRGAAHDVLSLADIPRAILEQAAAWRHAPPHS